MKSKDVKGWYFVGFEFEWQKEKVYFDGFEMVLVGVGRESKPRDWCLQETESEVSRDRRSESALKNRGKNRSSCSYDNEGCVCEIWEKLAEKWVCDGHGKNGEVERVVTVGF